MTAMLLDHRLDSARECNIPVHTGMVFASPAVAVGIHDIRALVVSPGIAGVLSHVITDAPDMTWHSGLSQTKFAIVPIRIGADVSLVGTVFLTTVLTMFGIGGQSVMEVTKTWLLICVSVVSNCMHGGAVGHRWYHFHKKGHLYNKIFNTCPLVWGCRRV